MPNTPALLSKAMDLFFLFNLFSYVFLSLYLNIEVLMTDICEEIRSGT
jgi:hypothetical protein